jgi:hypothetical protein
MRVMIIVVAMVTAISVTAQNNITANIIEGGKTLVDLLRIIKTPKEGFVQQNFTTSEKKDSCSSKSITDVCIKNSTGIPVSVNLVKRNGNSYEASVLSVKVLPKNQEYLYELKAGVYKLKIETEENGVKKILQEGEIKLIACQNFYKEVRNE